MNLKERKRKLELNRTKEKLLKQHNTEIDSKENKETEIPKNEKIKIRCLWVFEVYTPNYINNLIDGIDKINWDITAGKEKLSKIVIKSRESSSYGWRNLGFIRHKANIKTKQQDKGKMLPYGVDVAICNLFQYLSSTTILSTQFIFKEEVSNFFEKIMNTEYKTYLEESENGFRFITPFHQKKEEVTKAREELYESCYKWYKKNIPGLYSDNLTDVSFPTCEFITLEEGKPLKIRDKFEYDYIDVLGLANEFDAWECDTLKGIFLEFPSFVDSDFTRIKIAGKSSEILSNIDLKSYGGLENRRVENYLQHFDISLIIWSLFALTKTYRCNLSRIRDSIALVSFDDINKATNEIKNIRKNFALVQRNIPYFLNEFKLLNKMPFKSEVRKFKSVEDFPFNKDIELFDNILKTSIIEINNMNYEYENMSKAIDTTSNILLSITNEKLSRRNIYLQWAMIILTFFVVVLTIINFYSIFKIN